MFWQSSSTLLTVLEPDLRILEANPAWERVLGWVPEQLVGCSLLDLAHLDDVHLLEDGLGSGSSDGSLLPLEARLRHLDGGYLPMSFTGTLHDGRWYVAGRNVAGDLAVERGLRQRADFWQQTLDAMEGQVAVIDGDGAIVAVNQAWREVAGEAGRRTGPGENYLAICERSAQHDLHDARVLSGLRSLLAGTTEHFTTDYPVEDRWYTMHAARFRGEGPTRVVISHLHVTEHRRLADAAWTRAALLDEIDAGVVALDREDRVTHWNRGAERMFEVSREDAVGADVSSLVRGLLPQDSSYDAAAGSQGAASRVRLQRQDGHVVVAQVRHSPLVGADSGVIGRISVVLDAADEIRAEREAVHARNHLRAVTDSMGEGLFALDADGRVTVMNQAAEEMLGWSMADLDGQRIHDVIHHRYPDGRPFPADHCPLHRVHRDGETLRLAADVFVRRDGVDLPVTYTAAPLDSEDGPHGCVVVFIDATEVHTEQQRLAEELHELAWVQRVQRALEDGRFELFAQPIIQLASGLVTQHELLLRVRATDGSVEPPAEYLRTAEEHGLVGDIDRWVIQRSLELAATGLHVELNISAASIGDDHLLADIETWLAASGADPARVVFEITETVLIRDEAAARTFVQRLHELGCKVALDDFGTGYGGFTYLKQLPVNYLKIDIEFVRDLCQNEASKHVVQAVVNLARGFGLQTVAEGVEDEETLGLLRRLGVDFAQGYHIGRPGPLD